MLNIEPDVLEWILQAIARPVPFKVWETWTFDPTIKEEIKALLPPGSRRRDFPHVYASLNRPISLTWARELTGGLVVTAPGGTRSYVASREPLDPHLLYRFELVPLMDTRGDTLLSVLEEKDFPLVMARQDQSGTVFVAVASPDPSKPDRWRVTHFEENVGPIGHTEAEDARQAVREMINAKYTTLASSDLIDDIIDSIP